MKRTILSIVLLLSLAILGGCRIDTTTPAKSSTGEPYDVFVICDNASWADRNLAMAVCDLFEAEVPGMKRHEGYFNIIKQADPKRVTDLDYKTANIFRVFIDPTLAGPSTNVIENKYSHPQTMLTVHAPSTAIAAEYIKLSTEALRNVFEEAECQRRVNEVQASFNRDLTTAFEQHTGYKMLIPKNYYKAGTRDKELLWYILDGEKMARYIFAYSYDYTSEWDLTEQGIAMQIDAMLATIPGETQFSYMKIDELGPIITDEVTINNRVWYRMRGWWDVYNDYMGGIYTAYTTLDAETQRITTIIFGVYAPDEGSHIPIIRGMEQLIYTIE